MDNDKQNCSGISTPQMSANRDLLFFIQVDEQLLPWLHTDGHVCQEATPPLTAHGQTRVSGRICCKSHRKRSVFGSAGTLSNYTVQVGRAAIASTAISPGTHVFRSLFFHQVSGPACPSISRIYVWQVPGAIGTWSFLQISLNSSN